MVDGERGVPGAPQPPDVLSSMDSVRTHRRRLVDRTEEGRHRVSFGGLFAVTSYNLALFPRRGKGNQAGGDDFMRGI